MYIKHKIYEDDINSVAAENLPWEKLSGKNLLLTGATGLIGSLIIDVLMKKNRAENLNVKIFAAGRNEKVANERFADYFGDKNFEFVKLDVNNPIENNFRADFIIHAASNSHNFLFATDPVNTITANILGVNNLLKFAVKSDAQRLIFLSGGEVYGKNLRDAEIFDENYCGYIDCNTVRAGYPESKRASEALCQSYISQYNLDVVIVRPCRIYGATMRLDDSKAMSEFIRNGVRGEDIVLKSQGLPKFSFCYGADYVSSLADKKVVIELPSETQAKGFSKAVNAILDNKKLRGLGWTPKDDTRSGIKKTIEILKSIEGV